MDCACGSYWRRDPGRRAVQFRRVFESAEVPFFFVAIRARQHWSGVKHRRQLRDSRRNVLRLLRAEGMAHIVFRMPASHTVYVSAKASIVVAALQGVFGFTMMWASVFFSMTTPLGLLMVYSFFQGHAQAWCDVATIPLLADTFPNHKGTAIGFSKGFVGLAGAFFSQLYAGFFKPQVLTFVIMCAVIFAAFSIVGVLFMNRQLPGFLASEDSEQVVAIFSRAYMVLYLLVCWYVC